LLVKLIANLSTQKKNNEKVSSDNSEKLSTREPEGLREITLGLSNDEIGNKLNISATTVRTHRAKLLEKTGSNNTASLIMHAIKNKLVEII